DEYQDTNRVQYRLIKELSKLRQNICVVGDDAQSIYSFRGADIRNILEFEKDYPNCRVFRLEQNYRSTKTILDAAHSIIRNNTNQIPKKLWTENREGEPVVLTVCEDDREEGFRIVARVEAESRKNKLDLKDFAVLYRTNAQSRSLEDALRRSGIPYNIVGGVEFYKRREIKDVLAYLRLVVNPRDEESLLRIINGPSRSIGDTTIRKLRRLAKELSQSLFDALDSAEVMNLLPSRTANAVRRFHGLITKYIRLKSEVSASELARALVDEIGILNEFKSENTQESLARRENVQELLSALSEFSDLHSGAGLEDFLAEVSLVSDVDTADFGRNAVTLMTLHAAKGLEFPVIFITGLEEGLFPLSNSSMETEDMEEERRLFYVGMTRAMSRLYLSYALSRYRFGQLSYSVKSRFLDELDMDLVTVEAGTSRRRATPYRRSSSNKGVEGSQSVFTLRGQTDRDLQQYFSDPAPKYEDESQDMFTGRVGARVVHEAFGHGRIIALDGEGENARAIVDFESVGRKHLLLKFAHLRAG
ncbi:MAG: UvrD-helicase domain-containing protein, partial [Ignavibacteriae bacterium]|nr:UvrD-helicase domain-containing protein [Ignavibacteriota bacterium]